MRIHGLGLEAVEEREGGLRYVCGTTEFHLFLSSGSASGTSTQIGFEVEDIDEIFDQPGSTVSDHCGW